MWTNSYELFRGCDVSLATNRLNLVPIQGTIQTRNVRQIFYHCGTWAAVPWCRPVVSECFYTNALSRLSFNQPIFRSPQVLPGPNSSWLSCPKTAVQNCWRNGRLVFNGTFGINRLHHGITVCNILRMAGDKHTIIQLLQYIKPKNTQKLSSICSLSR